MSTLPKSQLVLGYTEFYNSPLPENRLELLKGICKLNIIAELAGLNYRLKDKKSKYHDTSLKTQIGELEYFCGGYIPLIKQYAKVAGHYTQDNNNYPLLFSRQMCLFGIEEVLQSDLEVIPDFMFSSHELWNQLLKYIFAVNTTITRIEESDGVQPINFETLNPKVLPLNELTLASDPIYIPFRGYNLLDYLHNHEEINVYIRKYFSEQYGCEFDYFVYETMGMFLANSNEISAFDFYYHVKPESSSLFELLSKKYNSKDFIKILNIRKYPFYKSTENSYLLIDNILLLEKLYNQFINDFWFDFLKIQLNEDGSPCINIKKYKSIIGYFFEDYVKKLISYSFENAKHYTVLQFEELKTNIEGQEIEVADVYIRSNSKIILGQVKSTTLYDNEKYGNDIDAFYRNDRNKFFDSFGVNQLVTSIKLLNDVMPNLDSKFPHGKTFHIYPVIIFNEKALQTPLMAPIFSDRFNELMQDFVSKKIHVFPISLIHVSDLENLQDHLFQDPNSIWGILKYHYRFPKFMPPFYNTINRLNIQPNYDRCMKLYSELIPKFSKENER